MGIRLLTKKEITAVKEWEFVREALANVGLISKKYLLFGKPFNDTDNKKTQAGKARL